MTDIKDKIIADLRVERDNALAIIKLMEEQQQRDEERHEHELREASGALGKLRERVHIAIAKMQERRDGSEAVANVGSTLESVRDWIDEVRRV